MVPLPWGSLLITGCLSGAGFVTMPMKRGVREASSTIAKKNGELTAKEEMERVELTAVVAEASAPSSLSSMVLACRTLVTLSGWSEIADRSGPANRLSRPDGGSRDRRSVKYVELLPGFRTEGALQFPQRITPPHTTPGVHTLLTHAGEGALELLVVPQLHSG